MLICGITHQLIIELKRIREKNLEQKVLDKIEKLIYISASMNKYYVNILSNSKEQLDPEYDGKQFFSDGIDYVEILNEEMKTAPRIDISLVPEKFKQPIKMKDEDDYDLKKLYSDMYKLCFSLGEPAKELLVWIGVCYNLSCSICDKIDYYKDQVKYDNNLKMINEYDYEDGYKWAEGL